MSGKTGVFLGSFGEVVVVILSAEEGGLALPKSGCEPANLSLIALT